MPPLSLNSFQRAQQHLRIDVRDRHRADCGFQLLAKPVRLEIVAGALSSPVIFESIYSRAIAAKVVAALSFADAFPRFAQLRDRIPLQLCPFGIPPLPSRLERHRWVDAESEPLFLAVGAKFPAP